MSANCCDCQCSDCENAVCVMPCRASSPCLAPVTGCEQYCRPVPVGCASGGVLVRMLAFLAVIVIGEIIALTVLRWFFGSGGAL